MFTPEPKSFGEISDHQIETKIQIDGGVNRLLALAEHYQKNFENPKINDHNNAAYTDSFFYFLTIAGFNKKPRCLS